MSKGLSAEKAAELAAFNEMSVKFMQATKAANARLSQREADLDKRAATLQQREDVLVSKESAYIKRINELTAALTQQTEIQKRQAEEIEALFRGATSATADGFKALDVSPAVSRTTSLQRGEELNHASPFSSSPHHPSMRNGSTSASGRSQSPGASRLDARACAEEDEEELVNSPTSRRTEPSPTGSSNRSGKSRNPHKYREGALSMEDSRYQVAAEVNDDMLAYTVHDPRIEELSSSHSSNPSQDGNGAVSEGGRVSPRVKKGIQGRPDFVPMHPEDSGLDFFREGVAADARRRMEREALQQQQQAGEGSSDNTSDSGDEHDYEEEEDLGHQNQYYADPLADTTANGNNAAAVRSPLRSGDRRATVEYGKEDSADQDVAHRLSPQDKQVVDEDNFDDTTTEEDDAREEEAQRLRDLASRRELFRREEDDSTNDDRRDEDSDGEYEAGLGSQEDNGEEEDAEAIAELEDRFAEAVEWLIDAGHVRDEEHITEILHSGNTPEDIIQWREALEDEENEEEAEKQRQEYEGREEDPITEERGDEDRSPSQHKHHPHEGEENEAMPWREDPPVDGEDDRTSHDDGLIQALSPHQQRHRSQSHEGVVHISETSEGGAGGGVGEEEDSRPTTIDRQLVGSAGGHGDSVSDAEEENDDYNDDEDDNVQRPRTAYGTRPSRLNGGGDYLQHHHIGGRIGGAGRLGGGTSPTSRGGDDDHSASHQDEEEDDRAGDSANPNDKQRLRVHGEEGDSTAHSDYDDDNDSVHSSVEPTHAVPDVAVVTVATPAVVRHTDPHHQESYSPNITSSSSDDGGGHYHAPDGHDDDHYVNDDSITSEETSVEEVAEKEEDIPIPPVFSTTTVPNLNLATSNHHRMVPSDSDVGEDEASEEEEDNAAFINNDVGGGSSSSATTSITSDDDDGALDLPGASSNINPSAALAQSKPPLPTLKFGGMMSHPPQDSSSEEEEDNNHVVDNDDDEKVVEEHNNAKIENEVKYSSSYSSESEYSSDEHIMDLPESPTPANASYQSKTAASVVPKRMVALSNFDDTSSEDED